jgi:hypothetical protein
MKLSLRSLYFIFIALFASVYHASAQPGILDTSFGSGGITAVICPGTPQSAGVQSDGKILILTGAPHGSRLIRLNPDGTLDDDSASDTTPGDQFGSGGIITINWPGVSGSGWPTDLALQTIDGSERIVIVGYAAVRSKNRSVEGTRVERLLIDGAVDTSFGNQGTVSFAGTAAQSIAVQSDQ